MGMCLDATEVWVSRQKLVHRHKILPLTILGLLYLMNYSTQDAIREGDCFLSAFTTEYTV